MTELPDAARELKVRVQRDGKDMQVLDALSVFREHPSVALLPAKSRDYFDRQHFWSVKPESGVDETALDPSRVRCSK